MRVVVCIKQVPDTEAPIRIRPDGAGIDESGLSFVMNYYDEHATEAGLRLREQFGGTVTLVSVGPERARDALRTGLAMGADEAILVCDPRLDAADHLGVARVLAAVIRTLSWDVVICGKISTDDNAGIVGPALAEYLGVPQATAIARLEVDASGSRAEVHREVEGGVEVLEVPLPAVLTVERSLNEPRYPSLPGIMKAKRTPIRTLTLADLGLDAPAARTVLTRLEPPPARRAGRILQGEPDEVVREIVRFLREQAKVL
ncbi:MAG: electron transfer flavoprotein subunit beta/FixA family protein [Armatimonadota bacterium]|nr:electron transfer flavoprotein subunit beta/FixA family protein [Armatimonadota bacterium]MDR7400652.1 electron transfer flavoprotein subunit beta/FixA family protein [Armatimonadota bacterium]MDR7403180.1 electron transfer flavoprotein subunit beta/FixA family protein [Armatimonadota bacterium]MDR7436537.1 electron transfer flavoprotein subunit beta/FixA family protein [Armatimonadota bacterium]MDR7472572.1 electron transfer flavoprotein subunit beta/FixA family protein [Armatimonadota bact